MYVYQHATEEQIRFSNSHEKVASFEKIIYSEKTTMFNKLADLFTNDDLKFDIKHQRCFGQGQTLHQAEIDAVCGSGFFKQCLFS